jgi:hypothetical protein
MTIKNFNRFLYSETLRPKNDLKNYLKAMRVLSLAKTINHRLKTKAKVGRQGALKGY